MYVCMCVCIYIEQYMHQYRNFQMKLARLMHTVQKGNMPASIVVSGLSAPLIPITALVQSRLRLEKSISSNSMLVVVVS